MALSVKDRVKETTSSAGVADFVLTGAVAANMQTFAAKVPVGGTIYYCAETATQFEIGLATRLASGALQRLAANVLDGSSGPGVLVNFAASPVVFGTLPGAMFDGGLANVFSVRSTAAQNVGNNVAAKCALNAKDYDSASAFDATTNYRFQPKVAGYYLISFGINGTNGASAFNGQFAELYLNGAAMPGINGRGTWLYGTTAVQNDAGVSGTRLVYLNGSSDYVELYGRVVGSGTLQIAAAWMQGYFIGSPAGSAAATPVPPVAVSVRTSANQAITNNTPTKIQLNTKDQDTANTFDAVTNYRFQPTTAGFYLFAYGVQGGGSSTTNAINADLRLNGSSLPGGGSLAYGSYIYNATASYTDAGNSAAKLVYMNGTTDYVELWGKVIGSGTLSLNGYLQCILVQQAAGAPIIDKARISKTSAQNTAAAGSVKVALNNITHDTGGIVDIANNRIKPKRAGFYEVKWRASAGVVARSFASLHKNGSEISRGIDNTPSAGGIASSSGSDSVYCNGTTDYLEMNYWCASAAAIEAFDFTTFLAVSGPF